MEEPQYMTLGFDDGNEMECKILGRFDVGEKEYIALVPQDQSGDVYIFGFEELDDEYELTDITDKDEFAKAAGVFETLQGYEEKSHPN
jgi:uncharacterized protein YrzB (UPF0473 family)